MDRRMALLLVGILAVSSGIAAPAVATHGTSGCQPQSTGTPVAAGGLAVFAVPSVLFVEAGPFGTDADVPTGVVVYRETNGLKGIQRDDAFETDRDCGHGADTLLAAGGCQAIAFVELAELSVVSPEPTCVEPQAA